MPANICDGCEKEAGILLPIKMEEPSPSGGKHMVQKWLCPNCYQVVLDAYDEKDEDEEDGEDEKGEDEEEPVEDIGILDKAWQSQPFWMNGKRHHIQIGQNAQTTHVFDESGKEISSNYSALVIINDANDKSQITRVRLLKVSK